MLDWMKSNSLYILLGIATIATFDWLFVTRKILRIKWYAALVLALLHVVLGVLAVKLFAFAEAGFDAEKAGSMSLFGAFAFMPALYALGALIFKRPAADVFDTFTVPLAFTLMCARVNCLIAGCCIGRMIGETGVRWPTREAELVFYVIFLIIVLPRAFNHKGKGKLFPIFMVAYGAFRAIIECFRKSYDYPGIFHLSHVWALATLAIGIIILVVLRNKQSQGKKKTQPYRR